MSSSIASLVIRRSLRYSFPSFSSLTPKHRHCSSFFPTIFSRVLIPQTLTKNPSSISTRFASSKALTSDDKIKRADENLLRVLESEIECAEEEDEADQEAALPKDTPFEIIDNPGDQVIILKREFAGEKIEATVYMNFGEEDEDKDGDDDTEDDDDTGDALQPTVSLVVTIDKESGHTLEFCCNLSSDEVEIESMALKSSKDSEEDGAYQGPAFSDLDESLQKALRKYLAARGIKGSLYDVLRERMMSKEEKEYKAWLKNLKEFVEK